MAKIEAAALIVLVFEATAVLNGVSDTLLPGSAVGKPPRDDSRLFVAGKRFFFSLLGPRFVLMGRQGANVPSGENKSHCSNLHCLPRYIRIHVSQLCLT